MTNFGNKVDFLAQFSKLGALAEYIRCLLMPGSNGTNLAYGSNAGGESGIKYKIFLRFTIRLPQNQIKSTSF